MIDFVCSHNAENNNNLHYSKTAILNKELVENKAIEDCKCLIEKETNYYCLF